MSSDSRWLALLALPVLCCAGHAVLLAVGVGSVTALTGGAAGSAAGSAGLTLLVAAALVQRRRRRLPPTATYQADRAGSDGGAP